MWRNVCLLTVSALVVAMAVSATAADLKKGVTDPAEAGPDFAVQGEYVGEVPGEGGQAKIGVQVIALGDGKFHAVGYIGGLPGDGWDGQKKIEADGQTKDGVTTFTHEGGGKATVKDGVLTIIGNEGKVVATLKKVDRKSPTLGEKPPAGAVVLFDGKTADAFKGGRMTPDGLLMEGATSKQNVRQLHDPPGVPAAVHARRPRPGPRQQRLLCPGPLRGADSRFVRPQRREQRVRRRSTRSASRRSTCACRRLSWQTYDIDFTAAEFKDGKKVKNARMTVRHNGVVIHENLELPHATTAAPVKEGPETGPIYLQNHGNPVRFRNIWVVPK